MSVDWVKVSEVIRVKAAALGRKLKYGQEKALLAVAGRLERQKGVILADEVGLGKTRVALIVADAVMECGGTVVAAVPPGLLYQWEKEYEDYRLQSGGVVRDAVKLRSFSDLFEQGALPVTKGGEFPLLKPRKNRWLIVSHNFGFHRAGTRPWRIELPALVRAVEEFGTKRRHQVYASQREYPAAFATEPDSWDGQFWDAAHYLARPETSAKFNAETKTFFARPDLRPCPGDEDSSYPKVAKLFAKDAPGYHVMNDLIGHLIGTVDLLIIDEAHKSREEDQNPEKQLGVLLERILRVPGGGRRLCLTATPVELGMDQWQSLLRRANVQVPESPIAAFDKSLDAARRLPGSPEAVKCLIRASGDFQHALKEVVVRRRRIDQAEMRKYFGKKKGSAHPHRELGEVRITFSDLSSDWKLALLSLEGQGVAAKGLKLTGNERLADTRYAFGLGFEVGETGDDDSKVGEKENQDPEDAAQYGRFTFWKEAALHNAGGAREGGELARHPRILKAADHIEAALGLARGDGENREKFLVFGRFTRPMRALQEELNTRYLLRCLDHRRPVIAGPGLHKSEAFGTSIYNCYLRIAGTASGTGDSIAFRGALATPKGTSLLKRENVLQLLKLAGAAHELEINYVGKVLNKGFFENELSCGHAIKKLSPKQQESLFRLIRSVVFVELYEECFLQTVQERTKKERIRKSALSIWHRYLEEILEGAELTRMAAATNAGAKDPEAPVDKAQKFDSINQAQLVKALDLDSTGHLSPFCRLLNGAVAQETRKILQAQFNGMVYPRVLIAQSLVGREGLNLHKKCRRVLMFHPEWNPAVVEQQIGRVDRIESLWTNMADQWLRKGGGDDMPKIVVDHLIFEGTYDEYQHQVLKSRKAGLNAQLFGELLQEEHLHQVPAELLEELLNAAPSFEPKSRT